MEYNNDYAVRLRKIKSVCQWDDIRLGEVYHIPPIMGSKRKDVVITGIAKNFIMYDVISGNIKYSEQLYRTDLKAKFIVKIKDNYKEITKK